MSSYDIRGMQASGMTTQQINDFIKQAEANAPKLMKDFRSQIDPQKVVAGVNTPAQPTKPPVMSPVKTPVKQPVRQPIKPPTMSFAKPLVRQPIKPPTMSPVKPQVIPSVKPSVKPRINQSELQKAYGDVFRQASGANKPQVMPPAKPQSVSGKNLYEGRIDPYEEFAKKGYVGDRNPKINLPSEGTPAPNAGPRAPGAPNPIPQSILGIMKKGGEAKKYTKGGKINLDACGVSTAQKSKKSPRW